MEIGLKKTQVVAMDLAVGWEIMKSRAKRWAAEQEESFRLHIAKELGRCGLLTIMQRYHA